MKHIFTKSLFVTLLMAVSYQLQAATLTSTVNRNQMSINETVTLTVSYDEQVNTGDLDLNALRNDFELLGVAPASSSNISVINGQTTREVLTRWTITMAAKREGTLKIPAFKIGSSNSKAIDIEVTASGAGPAQQAALQVATKADSLSVYPGQQLIIEVELTAADGVNNVRGGQLQIQDTDIQLLGQQNFQRVDNGIARQVVVWKYAVFPEQPGKMLVPVQTFTGIEGGSNSVFSGLRSRGQSVVARSNAVLVTVKPKPTDQAHPWLPASKVTIEKNWSRNTGEIRVGEPITRTIKIVATGQKSEAIPPLNSSTEAVAFKRYRDQPQLENTLSENGLVGTRIESEAIVPSVSGELSLPERSIYWWDTGTKRWASAVLPAESLNVLPALTQQAGNAPVSPANGSTSQISADTLGDQIVITGGPQGWIWKLATLMLALLCTFQFYRAQKLKNLNAARGLNAVRPAQIDDRLAWAALQQSFKTGDAGQIRKSLLEWSDLVLPGQETSNLSNLQIRVKNCAPVELSSSLSSLLTKLDEQLYQVSSQADQDTLHNDLLSVIKELKSFLKQDNKGKSRAVTELTPLYPA